jgi:hypothetical protein
MKESRSRKVAPSVPIRPGEVATVFVLLSILAWTGCKSDTRQEEERSAAAVARFGGNITRDTQVDGDPVVKVDLAGKPVGDADLEALRGLTGLHSLVLRQTKVTDAGIPQLKVTGKLRDLDLDETSVTDEALAHLASLTSLRALYLAGTKVTDAGLAPLRPLTKLRELGLRGTQVTDAGLTHLRGLTQLRKLDLEGTHVTQAGIEGLRKELPNVWISFRPGATLR